MADVDLEISRLMSRLNKLRSRKMTHEARAAAARRAGEGNRNRDPAEMSATNSANSKKRKPLSAAQLAARGLKISAGWKRRKGKKRRAPVPAGSG